jgi:rubrerythrin
MSNSPQKPLNHTGADLSPENVKKMLDACDHFPPDIRGNEHRLEEQRVLSTSEASSIGSMPLPLTLKGMVKKSFSKLLGNHPEMFLDKLGERLAYERTGVRLYEAAIAKALGTNEPKKILESLLHIKKEEAKHMELIKKALEELGADPTAMTPSADLVGVIGQGFIQVLTDPRTDMTQVFNTLLNIELIDNAAWELLIEFADDAGHSKLSEVFREALSQEEEHLVMIKSLLKNYLN